MFEYVGKTVLVVGAGKSGIAASKLLKKVGAFPILFDGNENIDVVSLKEKLGDDSIVVMLGSVAKDVEETISLVVLSPGVPIDSEIPNKYRELNIPIWGEVELAYRCSKGRVIAITGTNGKTTTTSLVGQIMSDYYKSVFVVGNIGNPYTEAATLMNDETVTVAEISSFQLETIENFAPKVSAILNITPDHLNRHHTMECYIETKEKVTLNQTSSDYIILNYDDEYTKAFGEKCVPKVVYFSSSSVLKDGLYLDADHDGIHFAKDGKDEVIIKMSETKLLGDHNAENIMAAIAMSDCFGVPMESILATVKEFRAVEHRIEFVEEVNGVAYYNDSKGTNVDAAIKGICAMNRPTYLIGGGYDKGSEYDEWINAFGGKVKKLILLGQTREKIAECARKNGFEDIVMVDSLEEAVKYCATNATKGEAVLLSPACASWGMFDNYEQRGHIFKDLVRSL